MASEPSETDATQPMPEFGAHLGETFQKKYDEFASDLLGTFPELETAIKAAQAIPAEKRLEAYRAGPFLNARETMKGSPEKAPGEVLPGVVLTDALWETTGKRTRVAVVEYRSILNLCAAFQGSTPDSEAFTKEWAESMMREARASLNKLDFENLSQTFFKAFGTKGENLPPLPEKFLKGKLAKLAEDMVKEFKPEDFGLSPEDMEACERDPTRAFEILMKASLTNTSMIQTAMSRVAKKLQDKVARGELRPQELVAEAEELMKEFQSHPAFVELMETFRGAFSFDDPETAREAGRDNDGRLAQVRARLRKKMEAKKAAGKK